jgi:23S rRNA pseudouridine2605 synthase
VDGVRLQKFLSHAGVASRRRAEALIAAGEVRVNGKVVRELGTGVAPGDRVEVAGKRVEEPSFRYVILNKPRGVVTTMSDPQGRRTVASIVTGTPRVVPVGRLDYDTEGLLLLTNDGDLAHRLTHPKHGVDKMYRAVVRGRLTSGEVALIRAGVRLEDGVAAPAQLRMVAARAGLSELDLTIHEGRNREVRRMFEALGHPVVSLTRLRFGPLRLGDLAPGAVRGPSARELSALRALRDADVP